MKKAIIGDNLASHLNFDVIQMCRENNIQFVLLIPNSTHLSQPLDVCVFRPVKGTWRIVLSEWKQTYKGALRKDHFPALLKKTIEKLGDNMAANIRSGFKSTGIYPVNRHEILKRLRHNENIDTGNGALWSTGLMNMLAEHHTAATEQKQTKRKRVKAPPGTSLTDFHEEEEDEDAIIFSNVTEDATEEVPEGSSSGDVVVAPLKRKKTAKNTSKKASEATKPSVSPDTPDTTTNEEDIHVVENDFVTVFLVYNFGTAKETKKYFVAKVIQRNVGRNEDQIKVDLYRKGAVGPYDEKLIAFKPSQLRDQWNVSADQIVQKLPHPCKERRGTVFFLTSQILCDAPLQ